MRNWLTTVGAVALCAAMTPQAWAATPHARGHAAQPAKSSLRGHQKADDDEADAKSTRGRKPTAADKACAAAKTKAQKAKACKKAGEEDKPSAKPTAAEKACASAKTKAAKARLCKKVDDADQDRPSKATTRRGAKDEPAETVVATGSLPDARGKVSEIAPPPEKIGKGDTLYAVSRRTGVPVEELADLNKLKKPYHVRLGQTLRLPRTRAYTVHSGDTLSGVAARFGLDADVLAAFNSFSAKTPIRAGQKIDLPPNADDKAAKIKPKPTPAPVKPKPPAPRPAPPVVRQPTYTPPPQRETPPPVQQAPAPETPAPSPALTPAPAPLQPSSTPAYQPPAQTGSYPGATALPPARTSPPVAQPPAPRAQPTRPTIEPVRPQANPPQPETQSGFQMIPAPTPQQPNARPTYGPRPTPQYTPPPAPAYRPPSTGRPIIQTNPAPSQSQVTAAGRGKFIWPVRGNVLSPYGLKANGAKNDGMNIQAQAGEPVRAAAGGEVVYAGDQVPSFGNLVLIKHPGGWVTAYANLGRITVQNRDQVSQGQQIGVAGQTGAVDSPQLHFEVRYAASAQDKALPVDPALVLPER